MRVWFRNIFLAVVGAISLVVVLFYYTTSWSPIARAGIRNERNSYQVRPGMAVKQALEIMGHPERKGLIQDSSEVFYSYPARIGASDDVTFCVGPDSLVTRVSHGNGG